MPLPSPDFWYGVAVTATIAALTYFFGVRRRRLTVTLDVTTLIPTGGEKLAVTWDGEAVPHPFLVQAKLEASRAGDITPSNYVGGSIALDVIGGRAIGVLTTDDSPPCSASGSQLEVEPFLLKRGKSATASFLASGANAEVSPARMRLADAAVSVRSKEEMRPRVMRALGITYVVLGLAMLPYALWVRPALNMTYPSGQSDDWMVSLVVLSLGLLAFADYAWRVHKIRSKRSQALINAAQAGVATDATRTEQP